jgi:hypothetical protein
MAKDRRAHGEDAWKNAKKICGLDARQVEMARRLGLNPKKLPGLRPSPQQRWKLPVGAFIEECYRKRFGGDANNADPSVSKPRSSTHSTSQREAHASKGLLTAESQLSDLVCYVANLADDLEKWLVHGRVDREIMAQVGGELREIAQALDSGAPISPVPGIPLPPRSTLRTRSRQDDPDPPSTTRVHSDHSPYPRPGSQESVSQQSQEPIQIEPHRLPKHA